MQALLEKLPGVASAETDQDDMTATIVYDKSVFDVSSVGDEGKYKFAVKEDSAAEGDDASADEDAPTDGSDKM